MKKNVLILFFCFIQTFFLFASGQKDSSAVSAVPLLLFSGLTAGSPRQNLEKAVSAFMEEYPGIEVKIKTFDHTRYEALPVGEVPDVCLWTNESSMLKAAARGELTGISDIWEHEGLFASMSSSVPGMSHDGRMYGIPYGYYHFGIYYRKDLFEEAGLSPPETWDELMELCSRLQRRGVTPFALGSSSPWSAALWFEYLNLRVNGYEYPRRLMAGEGSWLDPELDKVFSLWGTMTGRGCFLAGHESLSWIDALDLMIAGEAAMCLTGSFAEPTLEESGGPYEYGFFPFPSVSQGAGRFEVAPTGTLHIPAGAEHPDEARLFLSYMSGSEAQKIMMGSSLSPRNDLEDLPENAFFQAGYALLSGADGVVPFLDRSCDPGMTEAVMDGMKSFLLQPERVREIRASLEEKREALFPGR